MLKLWRNLELPKQQWQRNMRQFDQIWFEYWIWNPLPILAQHRQLNCPSRSSWESCFRILRQKPSFPPISTEWRWQKKNHCKCPTLKRGQKYFFLKFSYINESYFCCLTFTIYVYDIVKIPCPLYIAPCSRNELKFPEKVSNSPSVKRGKTPCWRNELKISSKNVSNSPSVKHGRMNCRGDGLAS